MIQVDWKNCKELLKTNSLSDNERLLVRRMGREFKIEIAEYLKKDLCIRIDDKIVSKDELQFYLYIPEVDLISRGY